MRSVFSISGRIVDVVNRRIFSGTICVENDRIADIREENVRNDHYILPGFIDAHVHIESSMLAPREFAHLALKHGTVATVSDPHEIANVLGIPGIDYMVANGRESPLKFYFGVPSCVPATPFETAGAVLDAHAVDNLLARDDMYFLGEVMNYPGVLGGDSEVMKKISHAKRRGKPVDGHAPCLRGEEAASYINAGILTDHECLALDEALDKANLGMHILIREGSAARNFDDLHPLLKSHPRQVMFCCDDLHPDTLLLGHVDGHVRRSVALGYDLFDVLAAACVNPVRHYGLSAGLLQKGDPADMIVVDNLVEFKTQETIIDGKSVARREGSIVPARPGPRPNCFRAVEKKPEDFAIKETAGAIRVIEVQDGHLLTGELKERAKVAGGILVADPDRDLLKIAVINRYAEAPPAMGFIRNFGIRRGAMASSVAHDSHNIVAVGCDDDSLCRAVNMVIEHAGGLSLVNGNEEQVIALPVAGLMSDGDGERLGRAYARLESTAKEMGSTLRAPYMSLSFMALLVIPRLKLSDRGLFDVARFRFVTLAW